MKKIQKQKLWLILFVFSGGICFFNAAKADTAQTTADTSPPQKQVVQISFSPNWTSTKTNGRTFDNLALEAKLSTPSSEDQRTSLGFSIRHLFGDAAGTRNDLLAHVDYYFNSYLQAGAAGGLQYIQLANDKSSYLKALLGLQAGVRIASWSRFEWSESSLWLMTGLRQSAGSSGSLLINDGTPNLKATTFNVGVYYAFSILSKQEE